MALKCKIDMKARVLPAPGSVKAASSGGGTGTCPECSTPGVMLSIVGGFVRAHTVASVELPENNPQPATLVDGGVRRDRKGNVLKVGKGLKEPQTAVTDTGVRTGDPRMAEKRRVIALEGAYGTGVVQVPRKVEGTTLTKSGKPRMVTKMVGVPATEEHVREALAYWQAKHVKVDEHGHAVSESARQTRDAKITEMFARLDALRVTPTDLTARHTDAAQGHRGPTLVRGKAMEATQVTGPREREGDKPVRPSVDGPLGRERFDKTITTVPEPARKRSSTERRKYRRAQEKARLIAAAGPRGK